MAGDWGIVVAYRQWVADDISSDSQLVRLDRLWTGRTLRATGLYFRFSEDRSLWIEGIRGIRGAHREPVQTLTSL